MFEHDLYKNKDTNVTRVVSKEREGAKRAVLRLKPIKVIQIENHFFTKVAIQLETGRSHQIRVQCAYEKHTVVGDIKYGQSNHIAYSIFFQKHPALKGQLMLHSSYLEFPHPMTKENLSFEQSCF